MAEEIIKRCDYPVGRGKVKQPHNEIVDDYTRFRVEGREYMALLCDEHKEAMMTCMKPFIDISRRAGAALPRNARGRAIMRAKGGRTFTSKDVRDWLADQKGHGDVPSTGRLPNAVIEEYKAAHGI